MILFEGKDPGSQVSSGLVFNNPAHHFASAETDRAVPLFKGCPA
jgi:hypothetical protein